MSAEQRAELVKKLKSEQTNRENQLLDIVNKMISKQANTFTKADDNFWKIFTQKSINIDPDTNFESIKAKAKEDISEDGYYGVKQTSQRLFDFASALAGDDVDKMKDMQKAGCRRQFCLRQFILILTYLCPYINSALQILSKNDMISLNN